MTNRQTLRLTATLMAVAIIAAAVLLAASAGAPITPFQMENAERMLGTRARAFQEKDPRVDIIDKHVDDHGVLAITSIYVGYLLPMMIEIQWWDFKTAGASA